MKAQQKDISTYIFILTGCLLFLFWLIPAHTPAYPGYGVPASLVPNVVVGLILVLSLLELFRAVKTLRAQKAAAGDEEKASDDSVHLLHLAKFFIPCVLLMPAMQWLGFIPAGIIFMVLMQFLVGQRKPVAFVLVAVIPVGLLYLAMRYALGVPMP